MIFTVSGWDNSRASWPFTDLSYEFCIMRCYYVCFGLLMQISLADYSAYLHMRLLTLTLYKDLFQGDF